FLVHPLPHGVDHGASVGRELRGLDRLDAEHIVKRRGSPCLSGGRGRNQRQEDEKFLHRGRSILIKSSRPQDLRTMDLQLPLDYSAIERILPHRYPFLLVDKITEF